MHELGLAQTIVDKALAEATKHSARRIVAINVGLGKEDHIEPSAMELCIQVAARGTPAEGAEIGIRPIEGTGATVEAIDVE